MSAISPHIRVLTTVAQELFEQAVEASKDAKALVDDAPPGPTATAMLASGLVLNGIGQALQGAAEKLRREEREREDGLTHRVPEGIAR